VSGILKRILLRLRECGDADRGPATSLRYTSSMEKRIQCGSLFQHVSSR